MKSKYLIALCMMLGLATFAGFQARAESGSGSDSSSSSHSSDDSWGDDDSDDDGFDDRDETNDSGMDSPSDMPTTVMVDSSVSVGSGQAVPMGRPFMDEKHTTILDAMEKRDSGGPMMQDDWERADVRMKMEDRFKNEMPLQARARVRANFGVMFENFDNIIARIETRIEKMDDMDIDTTAAVKAVADAKISIADAKEMHAALQTAFESENTTKEEVMKLSGELKSALMDVHESLRAVVKEMKTAAVEARVEFETSKNQ